MGQIKEVSACFGLDHLAMTDDGAVFDAVVAIVSALDIADLVNVIGVDTEAQAKLRAAHGGLAFCLDKTESPAEAISQFERFLSKKGESVAFMGEIFRLVVDKRPYETPQSIKDKGSGPPQPATAPSPIAKALSLPNAEPSDPIDQLFAGLGGNASPSCPRSKSESRSFPSSSDGADDIDRLLNGSNSSTKPTLEPRGVSEPDEIGELLKSHGF
jgi:hypothetical protein